MIDLLNKTGLGRSGHVRFQTFGSIWHVSGPEMVFWRNDIMILHHFCWRNSKIKLFWPKTLIFDPKSRKYHKNQKKYCFFWVFLDLGSNIKVFNQNNLIFELLRQKWCRIIMLFRQNTIFGPETCQIGPKVWNRTCPDLPKPVLLCKFIIFLWNHWFY